MNSQDFTSKPNSDEVVKRVRRNSALVGIGLLCFLGLLVAMVGFAGDSTAQSRLIGQQAPVVRGVSLQGDLVDTTNQDGWLVVNFFALWCAGCIAEHPELVKLEAWGKDNNLELVATVYDSNDLADIARFFSENGGSWPVVNQPATAVDFAVGKIPESFLINPDGIVVSRFQGEVTAAEVIDIVNNGVSK